VEFLTTMTTNVPEGTPDTEVDSTKKQEAAHSRDLAEQGHLLRLWKPPVEPGEWKTLGLWSADDERQLQEILATMPLHIWMTVEVTPLTPHPNDPGTARE
jgi:muconolactone delta-isomerase